MALNILEIEPNKVPTSPEEYSSFVYGPPKIGKTTLVYEMYGDRVLFAATEDRHKALPGAMIARIQTWTDWLNLLSQLRNPQVKERYDAIAVDTAENLAGMLEKFVAAKWNEKSIGERDDIWGKDWRDLKKMWKDGINKISELGYIPVFVGHATQKVVQIPASGVLNSELEGATYEVKKVKDRNSKKELEVYEFAKFMPDLDDRYMGPINKMVDNILFLNTTVDINTSEERRVIYLRDTLQWQAGSTFENIEPVIDLDAEAYREAVKNAIGEIDADQTTNESSRNKEEKYDQSFDEMMAEIKKYGGAFHKEGKLEFLNNISEEVFGLGKKVTDAKESQIELVSQALSQIKAKSDELGIKL